MIGMPFPVFMPFHSTEGWRDKLGPPLEYEGKAVRVLVAALSQETRDAFCATIKTGGYPSVDTATDVIALETKIAAGDSFDVLILENGFSSYATSASLRALSARLENQALVIALSENTIDAARARLMSGAQAVIGMDMSAKALAAALDLIAAGHNFAVVDGAVASSADLARSALLSERELQVLEGVCQGLQNKEIAHTVNVKEVTVKMHVRAIIRKLGAKNRTQAAMIARDLNLC